MKATHKVEMDGSITISLNLKPEGSMLEQEEQIAAAVSQIGKMATELSLKKFDTDGRPIIIGNEKHTSRGEEKKSIRLRTERLK